MVESHVAQNKCSLLFDLCRDIEGLAAELYNFYGDHFRDNIEISRMWKKTAMEEENHHLQFALAQRMAGDIVCSANVDIAMVVDTRDKLSKLVSAVRKNPPDLVTALSRAIELEERLADLHASTVVSFTDAETQNMFKAMIGFDQEHVETLRRYLAITTLNKTEMAG